MSKNTELNVRVPVEVEREGDPVEVLATVIFREQAAESFEGRGTRPAYWFAHRVDCENVDLSEVEIEQAIESAERRLWP